MDRGGWGTTVRRVAESDTTEAWKLLAEVLTRCAHCSLRVPLAPSTLQRRREAPLAGSLDTAPSGPLPLIWANEPSSSWGHARVTRTQQSDSEVLKRLRPVHLSAGRTVH